MDKLIVMKFDILKPQVTCGKGKKAVQEDCIFPAVGEATIHDKLFIACDGVGGDGQGYKASECFCQTMSDVFFQETCPDEPLTDEFLDNALVKAHSAMRERCPESLGTSFAMLYLHRHGCLAAHVGSARVYHFRPKERLMLYRSADDNRVFGPAGDSPMEPVKAHITKVQYGDYFVLATKGAYDALSERRLMDILCEPVNDNGKMVRIVKELSGCEDNHSVILVHVSGVMNEAMDEHLPDNEDKLMAAVTVAAGAVAAEAAAKATAEVADKTTTAAPQRPVSEKPQPAVAEEPQKRHAPKPRPVEEEPPRHRHHEEEEKSGFPVVLVTALAIVVLALLAWFWMSKQTRHKDEEVPAVEVKKDTVKKDTMNIMKSQKPKALDIIDENKPKEETKKEKAIPDSLRKKNESADTSYNKFIERPAVQESGVSPSNEGNNGGDVRPAQPVETPTPPANTQPASTSQGTAAPGTVTPRPVIPEDE